MDELKVIIEQKSGVISFENFDELKKQLNDYLEQYRGMKFTEESKASAKKTIAELRKLKKAINDRKIEVKKAFMQPYEEFDSKTKELMTLIEKPIGLIDDQVKVFEKKQIEERKQLIRKTYEAESGELAEYISLDRIYSNKWENASTSAKKIKEEMEQIFFNIQVDIESLKLMRAEPDIIEFALDKYRKGDTAVEAMRKANEFADLMEKRKEWEREEEKRKAEEEAAKQASDTKVLHASVMEYPSESDSGKESAWESESSFDLPFVTPATQTAMYRIVASDSEIADLELYMDSVGISFERRN